MMDNLGGYQKIFPIETIAKAEDEEGDLDKEVASITVEKVDEKKDKAKAVLFT